MWNDLPSIGFDHTLNSDVMMTLVFFNNLRLAQKIVISIWKQTVLCDSQMSYLTENILRFNN